MEQPISFDNTYARLPDKFFARVNPKPVSDPKLIKLNTALAQGLGLNVEFLSSPEGVAFLSGNDVLHGSQPLAQAYAGQQFGHWNPQLGDGRAHLLGEVVDTDGNRFDLQLKGSGPTPFSRRGDGRAWLGPVLREYIVSEAMAALGVSTTRALAAVSTGEMVVRENILPGAIVTRIAKSHVRVGTFQYLASRGDTDALRQLADYVIDRLHPNAKEHENPYAGLLASVLQAQAQLVARWMNLGFIHGVMNTDNVAISGETIDYGPCAFMDDFHADRMFSSIDEQGRYAYSNQPPIAHWNIVQFAQALLPILADDPENAVAVAQEEVNLFPSIYAKTYQSGINKKLGLADVQDGDEALTNELLKAMQDEGADFTNTFRALTDEPDNVFEYLKPWVEKWRARLAGHETSQSEAVALMQANNPIFIPRNHRIEAAIKMALDGDFEPFEKMIKILEHPYDEQPDHNDMRKPPAPNEIVHSTFCGT